MSGDGNGWVVCNRGHRHWGRFGAAGILVTDGDAVVLQHRAAWTHEGGTWALPGGAKDSHEDAVAAALREAVEETTLDPAQVTPVDEWVDEHGGWSYTTVIARTAHRVDLEPANPESVAVRWWPVGEVAELDLHAGFAAAWPHLLQRL
jgi:8-oxo-dGTP pyrophosphatase MutT (NUDIX family)